MPDSKGKGGRGTRNIHQSIPTPDWVHTHEFKHHQHHPNKSIMLGSIHNQVLQARLEDTLPLARVSLKPAHISAPSSHYKLR